MLPVLCPPSSLHVSPSSSGCLYLCFPEPLFLLQRFSFSLPHRGEGIPSPSRIAETSRGGGRNLFAQGWAWKEARGRGTLTLGEPTYAKKARLGWYPPTVYTYWCLPSFKVAKRWLLRPWTWLGWGSAIRSTL